MLVNKKHLQKTKKELKKFKETGDARYIYQNELNRACFQHEMVIYGDFQDLTRRTASDKILREKAFNVVKIQNMMDINADLLQWSINFLIKKLLVVVLKLRVFKTSLLWT